MGRLRFFGHKGVAVLGHLHFEKRPDRANLAYNAARVDGNVLVVRVATKLRRKQSRKLASIDRVLHAAWPHAVPRHVGVLLIKPSFPLEP